ncbi:uncharacterized protein NPIL_258291 [Nephila pilipes]|uniref:Uncharacterized protein n=1 Tax=Nephila pilipes TaxID=299642 RepID=A0A8X6PBE9_NEPPI|nr:uncharacterized protein NPIL_258291 [Nephila pilipes]
MTYNEESNDSQKSSLKGDAKQIETSDYSFALLFTALKELSVRPLVGTHLLSKNNSEKIRQESTKELRDLFGCVRENLRALKIIKYEQNNLSDVLLINTILHKLDKETRKKYEFSLKSIKVP